MHLARVLIAAVATVLALVPISLGGTRAGTKIEHPIAVVILGGLVTSTLLKSVCDTISVLTILSIR